MGEQGFSSEALWVARSFRGLKVVELAELSGVSRQFLSALENGQELPRRPALSAVAAALAFPYQFFFLKQSVPGQGVLHHRKKARVTVGALARVLAHASLFIRTTSAFGRFAKFRPPRLPVAQATSPEAIESAAASFRMALGLKPDAPLGSAIGSAEKAGVFVGLFNHDAVPVDGFAHSSAESMVIMLNSMTPWSRRRFSVMHEVGHLVLHRGKQWLQEYEEQADRFASSVLLPRGAFWREFQRPTRAGFDWASLIEMKQRWGVSIQALVRRAFDLQLINAAQYRTAFIHISNVGWRKAEPAEAAPEANTMVGRFINDLAQRGQLDRLCEAVGLYEENITDALGVVVERPQDQSRVIPFRRALLQT